LLRHDYFFLAVAFFVVLFFEDDFLAAVFLPAVAFFVPVFLVALFEVAINETFLKRVPGSPRRKSAHPTGTYTAPPHRGASK
jgi:hypothetical protein